MKLEEMCADIEWSKKLGHLFEKDATWWWVHNKTNIEKDHISELEELKNE